MPHIARFTLSDMVRTSAALRTLGRESVSIEDLADRVVHYLRDALVDPVTGQPDTALVRFYKTHPYGALPDALQDYAAGLLDKHATPNASMKCLTLLGTVGDDPSWCDRLQSSGHRAVPLPSEEVVARLPMIAQLISQFGLALGTVVEPDPKLLVELDEKTYNVFYVPTAEGSPHIPAQDFVADHGIASALGFGGMLPTGDLYAVVVFSKVPIPAETAELFKTLAVSVKVALLPLADGPLFGRLDAELVQPDDDLGGPSDRRLRRLAVEQLLEVHERIAAEQSARVEVAWEAERHRSAQLRALASAAVVINVSGSLTEIIERVTEQALDIVGANQAATAMMVDLDWSQAITASSARPDGRSVLDGFVDRAEGRAICAAVCETNRPVRMTRAEVEADPRRSAFVLDIDGQPLMRGWLAAPLVARDGRNLGVIQLSDKPSGEFTEEDEAILVQLAQMAAITVENAQLFEREHRIVAELQRSLLPADLPTLPGVEVAARYYAGAAGVDIGGDWYDVFPVGEGSLAVVLGDVAGRGIAAAAVMGQLRMALRAYAIESDSPSQVVGRLDRLLQHLDLVELATLAYGVWTPGLDGLDLVLAGHPSPLIISPDGSSRYARAEVAVPLGTMQGAAFPATRISIEPGSTLLLYSDGLVEARDLTLSAGLERLRTFASKAPEDLDALCEHVATAALAADADDDVTLLAVRFPAGCTR